MSNSVLQETLSTIELENGEFDKSFDLVNKLLSLYGEENLAEKLYNEIRVGRQRSDMSRAARNQSAIQQINGCESVTPTFNLFHKEPLYETKIEIGIEV